MLQTIFFRMKSLKTKPLTFAQRIAIERMYRLMELAEKEWEKNPLRTRRYIQLIRGFSTRFRTKIPSEIKNKFCKHCGNLWKEGENMTVRVKGKTMNMNCKIYGRLTRRKIGEEKIVD